jgi:hypothetical protein
LGISKLGHCQAEDRQEAANRRHERSQKARVLGGSDRIDWRRNRNPDDRSSLSLDVLNGS